MSSFMQTIQILFHLNKASGVSIILCEVFSRLPPFWIFEGKSQRIVVIPLVHHGLTATVLQLWLRKWFFYWEVAIHIFATSFILSIPQLLHSKWSYGTGNPSPCIVTLIWLSRFANFKLRDMVPTTLVRICLCEKQDKSSWI